MRVLQLNKTAVGATWAFRQTRELVRRGVDVHMAMPEGPLVDRYEQAGVTVHRLQTDFPVRSPWRFPRIAAALRRLVRDVEPHVIHSHFVGTTLSMRLALGRRRTPPRAFQVPGPLHLESPFFRRAEIATATRSDYWIASCEWTRQRYLQSGIPAERVFLSYYGVDIDDFKPQPPGTLRRELGIDDTARIIGIVAFMYAPKRYLGQTRGLKGHEDLIDALAILGKRRRDIVGVFVGGPWGGATDYEQRLVAYGKQRCGDRIHFLGTRSDVAALYADFDVAVHPSLSENVGGALESLVLGVPTIATNVGGFPDLVQPGRTGWLVPPKNPQQLAVAIEQALADPEHARALAQAGQVRARRLFDIRRNAEEVHEIYEQILKCELSR